MNIEMQNCSINQQEDVNEHQIIIISYMTTLLCLTSGKSQHDDKLTVTFLFIDSN